MLYNDIVTDICGKNWQDVDESMREGGFGIGSVQFVGNWDNLTVSRQTYTEPSFEFSDEEELLQTVTGETGTTGYCNISIPNTLLGRTPWFIQIDEKLQDYTQVQNSTHTSFFFNYIHLNNLQVGIIGGGIIPEFPTFLVIPLFVVATLFATAISKNIRKISNKKYSNT